MTGDEDSGVEAIGGDVVRCFLETGIVPSLVKLKVLMERTTYACIISSLLPVWEVPLYTTFAMASLLRQTGRIAHTIFGRTGDDCLAFQLDNQGRILRSLYCEAKCTAGHSPKLISDAHEKVSKAVLVDIPRVIEVLQDSSEPDAPQWIDALRQF